MDRASGAVAAVDAVAAASIGGPGAGAAIEPSEALSRARAGDVVLARGLGAATGVQALVRAAILESAARATSSTVADQVSDAGVEHMHRYLDPHQLRNTLRSAEAMLKPRVVELADRLLAVAAVPPPRPLYVCSRVWVRLHAPLSALEAAPDVLDLPYAVGALAPAPPHRDAILTHPRSTISLWLAIGPVRAANSMRVWPDDPDGDIRSVPEEPDLDAAVTPELEAGDLLLFDADHLHATVPNHTEETRVVITIRVVAGRLRYGPGRHWRPYYNLRLVGTPLERVATLRSRLTLAHLRRRRAEGRER
jgi:Phytanoyl-CoA dioxygenase (PhyH)